MTRLGALADEVTPVLARPRRRRARTSAASSRRSGRSAQSATPRSTSLGDAADRRPRGAARRQADRRRPARPSPPRASRSPRTSRSSLDEPARHGRHRAADGLRLLPGGRDQRLRPFGHYLRAHPDRQPLLDLRDRARPGAARRTSPRTPTPRRAPRPQQRADGRCARRSRAPSRSCAAPTPTRSSRRRRQPAQRDASRDAGGSRPPRLPPRPLPGSRTPAERRAEAPRPARPPAPGRRPRRPSRRARQRPCSTTCWETGDVKRRGASLHRGQPRADRRGDDARRRRRGLPGLQRQQRPAVRPDLPLKADVPSAAQLVRGNEVRVGGTRVGVVDEITPERRPDGRVVAQLTLKLETTVKPLPDGLDRPRPPALGARPEVRRAHARARRPRASRTARRSRCAQATPDAGRVRRGPQHVRRGDAQRHRARTCASFGDALAGRGQDLNRAIEALNPLLRRPRAGDAQPRRHRRRACARFFQALGATAGEVAPSPRRRPRCSSTSTRPSRASARVARPDIQDSISGGPPALDAAIESFPRQRPFLRNTRGALRASCARRPRAARRRAGRSPTRSRSAPARCARSVALNRRLEPTFAGAPALRRGPARRARHPRPRRTCRGSLNPTVAQPRRPSRRSATT